jgi:cyclic pyranopterin phosphate synthase
MTVSDVHGRPPAPRAGTTSQRLEMVDVGDKLPTRRQAVALGRIRMSQASFEAIEGGTNPKGDVLAQAEVAGILGAKRTSELVPLCHPLGLEQVVLRFRLEADTSSVVASCRAVTTAKTGVEMEALCGVTAALLAIYDLAKAVDPVLTISEVHVATKEGGKSGRWVNPLRLFDEEDASWTT